MKNLNNKLITLAKHLSTLSPEDLEKALINRTILDRVYLMRKNKQADYTNLLEDFRFRDLVILEAHYLNENR